MLTKMGNSVGGVLTSLARTKQAFFGGICKHFIGSQEKIIQSLTVIGGRWIQNLYACELHHVQ